MAELMNPAVLNTVCGECGVEHPPSTPCQELEPRTPELNLPPEECNVCPEEIVPAAAPIPEIDANQYCDSRDPAYDYVLFRSPRTGQAFLAVYIDPGCSRVMKGCDSCRELCPDADVLDRTSERRYGSGHHEWLAEGATMPLKFFVDKTHEGIVNKQYGWVVVGWHNGANFWLPDECIKNSLTPSFDKPFEYGRGDLTNYGASLGDGIGNIPYIREEVQVAPTAVPDDNEDVVDAVQTVAVTDNDFDLNDDLDVTTVVLIDPADDSEQTTVTVVGEGEYVSNGDGTITFTPETGVSGTFTIDYKVSDVAGNQSNATTATFTVTAP